MNNPLDGIDSTAKPLSEQIALQLRGMIFDQHRFQPGDRLPDERSLAIEMGVSRTSLREAIKILVAGGVLVIRRGVGTFVSETPGKVEDPFGFAYAEDKKQLLSDWYQCRLIIESEAMELVAKNAADEELEGLEELALPPRRHDQRRPQGQSRRLLFHGTGPGISLRFGTGHSQCRHGAGPSRTS